MSSKILPLPKVYENIMAVPTKAKSKSGPLKKGKRAKAKKLQEKKARKRAIGSLKVVLRTDAGGMRDASSADKAVWKNLESLSESELANLMKKVKAIASDLFREDHEEAGNFDDMQRLMCRSIRERIKASRKEVRHIKRRIGNRLKKMGGIELFQSEQGEWNIKVAKDEFRLSEFIEKYFSDLIIEYQNKVINGVVIPEHPAENPQEAIESIIRQRLLAKE
ncbi:MAG: hypothetical protein ACQEP8_04820 [Chlamydiota bacterium]